MLPEKDSPFWILQNIYGKFINPYTQTAKSEYLLPILIKQFKYYKDSAQQLSLAIVKIPFLPATKRILNLDEATLLKQIISIIRKDIHPTDMIFYNGAQEITFLLPKSTKDNTKKMLNTIKKDLKEVYVNNNPLSIRGGYAEFPSDSTDITSLLECAVNALNIANQTNEEEFIGYFTEKRKSVRIPLKIPVRYGKSGTTERITCSKNISTGGIMISGMSDLPLGNNIKLTFKLPIIGKTKIITIAKNIWNKINKETGKIDIGLCFTNMNNKSKEQVEQYIHRSNSPITYL